MLREFTDKADLRINPKRSSAMVASLSMLPQVTRDRCHVTDARLHLPRSLHNGEHGVLLPATPGQHYRGLIQDAFSPPTSLNTHAVVSSAGSRNAPAIMQEGEPLS
jgi:hypothetical protein